ncbi:hypothetical protein BD779DRAFT_1539515 [Infundibulicybe gibba]|nr:hypothetical protein BD779DRAFT_1539515 [Infundibulicybe gibba]
MSLTSLFSSFFTVHADAQEESQVTQASAEVKEEEPEATEEAQEEEKVEEEEEPEDIHPTLREECQNSTKCAALTKHFEHCQEKVQGGQGFKGEDCDCVAPKLFSKLK